MPKIESLADFLGTSATASQQPDLVQLEDVSGSPEEFCKAVLDSREFRQYIVNGFVLGSIPQSVVMRIMDTAGWPNLSKKLELTGKDGEPVEIIRRIVRVVVDPRARREAEDAAEPVPPSIH